jgi:hypothetical protein
LRDQYEIAKKIFFWFVLPVASLIIMLILFGRQMVFGYLSPPDSFVLADAPKAPDFVHSTGFVGPGGWNSTMKIENSEAQSIEYMLLSMASIFNGCCNIYAPHYREAQLQSLMPEKFELGTQALDLAYQDVEAVFDYYLTHYNQGRPFIVVGYS